MRELYRWECGRELGAPLARDALGAWIAARENEWNALEDEPFATLTAAALDPFDAEAVNAAIGACGLAYGAGLAGRDRPGFFLAERIGVCELDDGLTLLECGRELARGLIAPPAALAVDTIVLRRESLARWLWQMVEAFELRRAGGAFERVVAAYGLDRDFHAGLPRALAELGDVLVLHERGEHRVGRRLGPAWAALRLAQTDRRADLDLRALRDLLADLESTLPALAATGRPAQRDFWMATFDGMRAQLAPALAAACAKWNAGDGGGALRAAIERGRAHFWPLAERVLAAGESAAVRGLLEDERARFAAV